MLDFNLNRPLPDWSEVAWKMHRKGVSVLRVSQKLGVTFGAAWDAIARYEKKRLHDAGEPLPGRLSLRRSKPKVPPELIQKVQKRASLERRRPPATAIEAKLGRNIPEARKIIVEMLAAGRSFTSIGAHLGISPEWVMRQYEMVQQDLAA